MRRGFTLIELIIVIALIALVGSLVVVNAQGILRGIGEEPVERVLQKAVREARFHAASLKEETFLQYDEETGRLLVYDETGSSLASFALDGDGDDYPGIEFEQILPAIGRESFTDSEAIEIARIVFRPDRSSTPFQVNLQIGSARFSQRYDPFSSIIIHDSLSE